MAANLVSDGRDVSIVAPSGGVTTGVPVVLNQLFGVALVTAVSGANAVIHTGGVWTLAKANAVSTSFAVGENVYWDATNAICSPVTSFPRIGVAMAAVANTDTSIRVRLNESF